MNFSCRVYSVLTFKFYVQSIVENKFHEYIIHELEERFCEYLIIALYSSWICKPFKMVYVFYNRCFIAIRHALELSCESFISACRKVNVMMRCFRYYDFLILHLRNALRQFSFQENVKRICVISSSHSLCYTPIGFFKVSSSSSM